MKKKSDSCPKAAPVCEKIRKAVTVNPAFQAIRRISSRPQEPRPATPAPNSSSPALSVKTVDIQSHTDSPKRRKSAEGAESHNTLRKTEAAAAAATVPVNFDHSSCEPPPPNGVPKSATQLSSVPKKANHQVVFQAEPEAKTSTMAVAQSRPAQGNKASPKLESPDQQHNKEEGKISGLHIEDRFTEYIKRAKIKMRSLSNVRDHDHDHKHASRKDNKFTDYINRAKAKLRTTSSIGGGGRSSSFK